MMRLSILSGIAAFVLWCTTDNYKKLSEQVSHCTLNFIRLCRMAVPFRISAPSTISIRR
jgi:hypothetical protein